MRSGAARNLFATTIILVTGHLTLLVFYPHRTLFSNLFILGILLLASSLCLIGARVEGPETRPLWMLLGCGFLLSSIGQMGWTYSSLAAHIHIQTQAFDFDFFFFAYSIPILLSICSPNKDAGLKTFAWLDGAQALIAALLAYLLLFSVLPTYGRPRPISAIDLMYLNDVEAWILVAAVTLRFFSNPSPARRRFYLTLALYLWANAIVVLVLGYLELRRGWRDGLQDVAWGLPYLLLFGSFAFQSAAPRDGEQKESRGTHRAGASMELLIDNLSPILFTLAIALMGVAIAPEHPWIGFVCITVSVAIYGIRAAILQVSYARSQAELTRAMIAIEEASRAKSRFLANMSHEIRTPMNGILGMTELALSTTLTEEQRGFLLTVQSSGDHLLTIINEILDYSKLEAGKTILASVEFDLPSLVGNMAKSLAFVAHQKGLEITLQIDPDVPANLTGDPVRLAQILINLLGNAIKFTEHGEVSLHISLRTIIEGRVNLEFSVHDTGIGIAFDQQEGLFQEFHQAETADRRLYGGTGLGLAVSRSIARLMGGEIGLTSTPGVGTNVTFHAYFDLTPASQPLPLKAIQDFHRVATLIIDDNATSRKTLAELACQWNVEPHLCDSGESGLDELSRAASAGKPYRLLLLDEQMPGMSGIGVLDSIRRNPLLHIVVIMMLTSHDQVRSAERCRQRGVEFFLVKPIGSADLLAAIRLAIATDEPPGIVEMAPPGVAAGIPISPRPLTILLAEDNLVNQRVAIAMLSKMGHHITLAVNGTEALERWRQSDFDLILMDVQMPQMTGLEATARIRREEAPGVRVPILAMTASAMSEERDRCLAAGMDGFISKPVSYKLIEQTISATCIPGK
jgi:signal transduction histidine kinase/CheY-like chemotaxis protein